MAGAPKPWVEAFRVIVEAATTLATDWKFILAAILIFGLVKVNVLLQIIRALADACEGIL